MTKPSSTTSPVETDNLTSLPSRIYPLNFEDRKLFPVETSSYQTVNFQDPQNENALLHSIRISACAVVLIKNFNEETGKYDNIVTMGHFHPANAYNSQGAFENLGKIFSDFKKYGGSVSSKTSVILLGGGLLPGEDVQNTTPLGPLIDNLQKMSKESEFKFTRHEASTNDLRGFYDPSYPTTQSSAVFVNKDGTAIIGNTVRKSDRSASSRTLTKSIDSMPFQLLTDINAQPAIFYSEWFDELNTKRMGKISELLDRKDSAGNNLPIAISSMEKIIELYQQNLSKNGGLVK